MRFLDYNSSFITLMNKLADLVLLNILFIVGCLPIFTIGASLSALYYVSLKLSSNSCSSIMKSFFKSFIENFKQASIIQLLIMSVYSILVAIYLFLSASEFELKNIFIIAFIIIAILLFFIIVYIFPLISRFHNSIAVCIKNAFIISITNLKYTLLIVIIYVLPFSIMFQFPKYILVILTAMIIFGFSVISYMCSFIFSKIFNKYITDN
ncbi:YesL family protein [Clostridium beijerinckii]|uniref:YesL family protein n=1 Tax=Clostridium beijerinckii TaxID=1520 RepID=UPI001360EC6C|nr:DUF624 domain-containing protein [Clostridium beijerinckii]MZK52066.1 DUF624 domain-containing protein [Clostridium beijerinckii]MZK60207.1 DUF624 domain-containing protein [Clostridium beijerinckii]MZK70492.1 DUF624 domain-containing protein [Clostridium beijerinckii]MZK75794.1 DUF624 domain-containing protein [Clostridium beijerinckii]MZK85458.1 DUF624 domain-containing protein [Clostridium beijerinckii]